MSQCRWAKRSLASRLRWYMVHDAGCAHCRPRVDEINVDMEPALKHGARIPRSFRRFVEHPNWRLA